MRRRTLVVAAAVLVLSAVPFVPMAPRAALLTLAAVAIAAAVLEDHGRVAALATFIAFTSSAVVVLGGLAAARPAADTLPTAGVLWFWACVTGWLVASRLLLERHPEWRTAGGWFAAYLITSLAAWTLRGAIADVVRVASLVPLAALVGVVVAGWTEPRSMVGLTGPGVLGALAAAGAWQGWVVHDTAIEVEILGPFVAAVTLALFADALVESGPSDALVADRHQDLAHAARVGRPSRERRRHFAQ